MDFNSFVKAKSFFYQGSSLYGGISGVYDYGSNGTRIKKKLESLWSDYFLRYIDNSHLIEPSQIMHEKVFEASGHLSNFTDPVIITSKGFFERADHFIEKELKIPAEGLSEKEIFDLIKKNNLVYQGDEIVEVKKMNLMLPVSMKKQVNYLRPETAQGVFVNFKQEWDTNRQKLPLALAHIGKSFRNEISPRNQLIRLCEFNQAELQIFFDGNLNFKISEILDKDVPSWYNFFLIQVKKFYLEVLSIPEERFRLRKLSNEERAFYNKIHYDVELNLEGLGWTEVAGIHYRGQHDLKGHFKLSNTTFKDIPHVLELSFGIDRNIYSIISLFRGEKTLNLPEGLETYEVAVFPLMKNNEEIMSLSESIYSKLADSYFDVSGSIGKRYARADEIGVRYCMTIDHDSLNDGMVTLRDRETKEQERILVENAIKKFKNRRF